MPQTVHIILPNRIGDSILAMPMLLCLRQLMERYGADFRPVTAFSHVPLSGLFQALGIFEVRSFDRSAKFRSWFNPPDKAIFLSTTSHNIGYRAGMRYGLRLENKNRVRYDVNLPFLLENRYEELLPQELIVFLRDEFGLPGYAMKHFGVCLELGFTVKQIVDTFRFGMDSLTVDARYFSEPPPTSADYVVICMEAAYGRKRAADRRWDEDNFLQLAERVHADYGLDCVFVGLLAKPPLPATPCFIDLRGRLSLEQTASVLHHSRGYIGNDTGPLHLANLLKKRSIGLYHRDEARPYWPLFSGLNTVCTNIEALDTVYERVRRNLLTD